MILLISFLKNRFTSVFWESWELGSACWYLAVILKLCERHTKLPTIYLSVYFPPKSLFGDMCISEDPVNMSSQSHSSLFLSLRVIMNICIRAFNPRIFSVLDNIRLSLDSIDALPLLFFDGWTDIWNSDSSIRIARMHHRRYHLSQKHEDISGLAISLINSWLNHSRASRLGLALVMKRDP